MNCQENVFKISFKLRRNYYQPMFITVSLKVFILTGKKCQIKPKAKQLQNKNT